MENLIPIRDIIGFDDELTFEIIQSAFNSFPVQLTILNECRINTTVPRHKLAINLLLLKSCTAFIESILNENFVRYIEKQLREERNESKKDLLRSYEDELAGATFQKYIDLAIKIFATGLNTFTSNDTWESIRVLFKIRNQIVHGKRFSAKYSDSGTNNVFVGEFEKGYREIISFLSKKKFIDIEDLNLNMLLSDQVTDYFIGITKDFFVEITKKLSDKFDTLTHESLQYLRSELGLE